MSSGNSISTWILGLKAGEAVAAQQLWDRYSARLLELARVHLQIAPEGAVDEEDIAQCVFNSVCRGAAAGRFTQLTNRDDLWWLLLAITRQKVVDHVRRETSAKRGGGRVIREVDLAANFKAAPLPTLDQLVGQQPTADFLTELDEQHQRLLALLRDDLLRQIALYRIEGYSVREIAAKLDISVRSVERKLTLIRRVWARDLLGD
jgi:DNA-directed RNA polymerase specialized sigma24 family protein